MSPHAFHVTGDPADLPPGAKMIEVNLTPHVEVAARAIHEDMADGSTVMPQDWGGMDEEERSPFMRLGYVAIMALLEAGWHPQQFHDLIRAAEAESTPKTGMDPR